MQQWTNGGRASRRVADLLTMFDGGPNMYFSLDGAALEMNKRRQTFKITTWRAATDRWRRSFKEGDEVWERHRLAGGEPASIVCEPSLCFAPDGGWP
jgi:hypothetical protein